MQTDDQPQSASPSILLAEDNPQDVEWFRRVLEPAGYSLAVAGNGAEALEYLRTHPHPETHLAIIDLLMPVKDGFQLALDLQMYVELRKLPLILVSGATDGSYLAEHVRATYLSKPIDPDELLGCVARLLSEG